MTALTDLAARLAADLEGLDREIAEIDLLASQAATEGARHEQKRGAAEERLAAQESSAETQPAELVETSASLLSLTRRSALMDSQIEVLEGKRKTLQRFRDALAGYLEQVEPPGGAPTEPDEVPGVSRIVLSAQEELRREIARAMHDGPAQSLTNIVLQAQIVQRLIDRDPQTARGELSELIVMVQKTLDATQSFIFDVRPMVLDDLGLVPTLRRTARDRGRRAGVPIEFGSLGPDRRLPMELESGLFRILDEALAAYVAAGAERVALSLDWSGPIEARVAASGGTGTPEPVGKSSSRGPSSGRGPTAGREAQRRDLPPALAAMIAEREEEERGSGGAAPAPPLGLPADLWRDIEARAATLGVSAELRGEGAELRLTVEIPPDEMPWKSDSTGPSSY